MKLETVMSLGYIKGRYWVSDDMFAKYAQRPSYKSFLAACRIAGFALRCEYSYTAQRYTAEVITFTKMTNSANYYFFKHNNAYDSNPLSAMGRAAVESDYATPLIRALVLEMECELLRDAYQAAVEREAKQARLEAKLLPVLNSLSDALGRIPITFMQGDAVVATTKVSELRSKPVRSVATGSQDEYDRWCDLIINGKPRAPVAFDEDDDL